MRFNLQNSSKSEKTPNPQSILAFNQSVDKVDEIERQKKILQEKFQQEFNSIVKHFFEAVPSVKSITWSQYTPYFNDGDACYFGVHTPEFASDENEEFDIYRDFSDADNFSCETYNLSNFVSPEELTLCKKMESLITGNEDFMKELFGDHVKVRLTLQGSETEEYEHD